MNSIHAEIDLKVEFKNSFMEYIEAVKSRNGKKVQEFFKRDLPMTHVLPGAKIYNDLESYLENQRHWHEGTTGSYDYKINNVNVSSDMGFASVFAQYVNIDPVSNKPFHLDLYISFLFRRVDGRWYMIHSQNSVLKEIK
jgi:hypothetical protein